MSTDLIRVSRSAVGASSLGSSWSNEMKIKLRITTRSNSIVMTMQSTMKRLLLTASIIGLLSSTALAADEWTDEERQNGVKREEVIRYAFSGNKTIVAFYYALDIDCSPTEGWAYEIIKKPEHGIAELVPQTK